MIGHLAPRSFLSLSRTAIVWDSPSTKGDEFTAPIDPQQNVGGKVRKGKSVHSCYDKNRYMSAARRLDGFIPC
jgi:hypothetical protein